INSRYSKLEVYYVRRPMIEELLSRSAIYLENANNFLRNFTYEKAYQNILIATSYLSRAYSSELMPTYEEATYSITFFSLLIILFSVFSSKFFMMSGFKKFLTVFIIALSLFCIFYFVHPSFYIIANSMIAIVGVGIALLLTFIILIFMMDIKSLLEKVSVDKLGFHLFKQEDLAIMIQTIIVSIENMKRRPLLTSLVFLTIIMYTAAQVSLTSTVPILTLTKTEITANSPYNGVLIKNVYGAPPEGTLGGILDIPIFDFLYGLVGNNYTLSPRVWLYPRPTYPEGVQLTFISLKEEGKTLTVQPVAVLGISDEEIKKFNMITGGWMEFLSDYQCILPYSISNQLNVTVGDKIYILGLDRVFTVSGIMDIGVEHIDFDGRSLYPLDPGFSADLQLAPPIFVDIEPFSLSLSNVIVIPWKTALKLGGFISSIALIPKIEVTAESLRNVASEIVYGTDLMVYFGYEGRSYGLWKVSTFQFLGWESSSILLIIISLSIANLMMGSYQMRRKEIDTCSVLGLSPKGASLMYLTESIIFALGGTIIGYLLGFALNRMFISIGVLPQSFIFNFASISIILSMAILIVAVMLSSLYPSIIISKHVTPSLERRWKVSSKPRGDVWELKMPLKADENEVLGVLMYLREYFEGLGSEQPKFRITNIFGINPREKSFSLQILLLPAELSIVQNTLIQGILEGRDYSFYLVIRRVSGEPKQWVVRCPQFIDHIRKQLLLWKTLDPKKKAEYVARSRLLTTESAY
ncbi:ABC transporter permease, partial [Candidatus Bathyarchaeota archaeon]|nr:ABC transporter permease [Candidatus Bathyarchaeota archaeon]